MTVDVEERLRAYAVTLDHAIEARRSPTQGARPLDHSTRGDRRPRARTLVASACVAAVVATVIVVAASGRSDHRALTSSNPVAGESAVPVPGITASAETPSPNTAANGVFADRVTRIVGPLWSSAVVEKQTRVTLAGATVQWVYLSDGDRRLFVTTGPSGELSDEPGLLDRLNLVDDANSQHVYAWPAEPIANTVAVVTNDQTVIVRSEAIESTGTPRPISDLTALLRRIAPPSVSSVTGDSQTATTVPTESTTTTTATTSPATPTTVDGIPLDQLGVEAGPVALGTVPDGYRPVMAFTDPAATAVTNQTVPTAADGWSATYLRVPEIGQTGVAPYLSVIIENITNDDPYWGYPGTLAATDTTLGAFSGRFDNSTPGYPEFIARLNDTQHIVITGRVTVDDLTTFADGLVLTNGDLTATATDLPAGYQLIDQGSRNRPQSSGAGWAVGYAKGQLESTLINVRAVSGPRDPSLVALLGPGPSTLVDIDGHVGVLNDMGIVFDVSPTFQVRLEHGMLPRTTPDQDLVVIARSIVGISDQQFSDLQAAAAADPLSPTDEPCVFYVTPSNARSTDLAATNDNGTLTVPIGATVSLDLSTTQPLGQVTFGLSQDAPPDSQHSTDLSNLALATLDHLSGARTIELTWDGTVNGEPAPSGTYTVAVGAGAVSNPTPGSCDGIANAGKSIQVRFRVP